MPLFSLKKCLLPSKKKKPMLNLHYILKQVTTAGMLLLENRASFHGYLSKKENNE
jgi:hypothetical protein